MHSRQKTAKMEKRYFLRLENRAKRAMFQRDMLIFEKELLRSALKNLVDKDLVKDKGGDHYQEVLEAIKKTETKK